jgi:replicative DNA helicase
MTSLGHTPPHSIDAERAVLGAILREPLSLNLVADKVATDDFFLDVHRRVFKAMVELDAANEPTDIVTVADRLQRSSGDGEPIGPAFLVELTEKSPVAQNVEYYAELVKDYKTLRDVIGACQSTIAKAMACQGKAVGFVEDVEREFLQISARQDRKGGIVSHIDVLNDTIAELEKRLAMDSSVTGVTSGFTDLDAVTGGWQKTDLIILAARPAMGKTAFALNCTINAVKAGHPVIFFSLEMANIDLMSRLVASEGRVDSSRLRRGDLTEDDRNRLMQGVRQIGTMPAMLGLDETPGLSLMEIRSRCRRFKKEHGLGLVVIDYLQLISASSGRKSDSREREIAEISSGLKSLAKELEIPIVALAQLNRESDKRIDKRPKMSDLRESGSIEMDADLILFVYRDEYYNKASEDAGKAEIIIGKNRHGSTENVMLAYQSNFVSFHNLMKS